MKRFLLTLGLAMGIAAPAMAQEVVRLPSVPAVGSAIADIANNAGQMAEGRVTGGGRWLQFQYQSAVPVTGFVVPFVNASQYNPLDMVRFDLPVTDEPTIIEIDLASSTSWNSASKDYMVSFASPREASPLIANVQLVSYGIGDSIGPLMTHMLQGEDYVVSTYHHLRGYRVLGVSALSVLIVLFVCACIALVVYTRSAAMLMGVGAVAVLLYGVRIDLDLLRLSASHLSSYTTDGQYAEAGSMYDMVDDLEALESDVRLAVCFDATDYFAKILRYALLPIPVQMTTTGEMDPTHVAVVRAIDWSYEDGRLRCKGIDAPATLVREYPDGSRLFSLTQ